MNALDDFDDDYDDFDPDEHGFDCDCDECRFENAMDECGLRRDGGCSLSGSEHCDFDCPLRDMDLDDD